MQIHELNNFTGTLGSGAYLAVDDGTDTGKLSTQQLLAATEARIDNIIAGPAPSAEEIVDARLGADGVTYPSLGDAIRDQITDVKSAINDDFKLYVGAEKGVIYDDVNALTWITPSDTNFFWIGTAPKDGKLYEYYGIGTSGVTPYIAVVRNSILVSKVALEVNTGDYVTSNLNIEVKAGDDIFIGGAVGAMALRTDNTLGITIKQFPTANVGDTVTVTTTTGTKFRYNLYVKYVVGSVADLPETVDGLIGEVGFEKGLIYNDVNALGFLTPGNSQFYWIGTATQDCYLTKYYGKGTSGVVPYIAVVRGNTLVAKVALNQNTGDYLETELSIWCKKGDDVFIGGAVGAMALRTDNTLGITIKQFPTANVGSSVTITTVEGTKFRYNLYVEWSVNKIQKLEKSPREVVTVGTGKDFTKLTEALDYAYDKGNCDVYVSYGTYDIYTELGGSDYFESWVFADTTKGAGPVAGNNCRYIFAPSAKVKFNYSGTNNQVMSDFSPINIGNGDLEIIGLNLNASNCRYCIHDEMGRAGTFDVRNPVVHIYKDLNLYIDNTANTGTTKRECIGGGLGNGTHITIKDSKFESATPSIPNVYWHNYGNGGISKIDVTGCDFTTGTFEAQYYGSHADVTECMVNNCKMAIEPSVTPATSGSTVVNMSINKWNNVVG